MFEPEASRTAFTPALAYSVLTPAHDIALEVLGFGRSFKAAVARLVAVKPGEAVLDLGCGTGTLLQALPAHQRAGELPELLTAAGFHVIEVGLPHRGVRHLLGRPQPADPPA